MTTTYIGTHKDIMITYSTKAIAENWFYSTRTARFLTPSIVKNILENISQKNSFKPFQVNFTKGKQKYSFTGDDWDCLDIIEKYRWQVKAINEFTENNLRIVTIFI